MIHDVVRFNSEVLGISKRSVGMMPSNEVNHLVQCLNEETEEFRRAYEHGDLIGMVDALIDNIYFALGGFWKMGLPPEAVLEIFSTVHEANMTKNRGKVDRRDTGAPDAIKPNDWVAPEERIALIINRYVVD